MRVAMAGAALLATALVSGVEGTAVSSPAPATSRAGQRASAPNNTERHRYVMSARVRPLPLSWIGASNVGEAVLTHTTAPEEVRYSLLIGTDPDRAPRRINGWGYLEETIHGDATTVVGLMTRADEKGEFTVIRATIDSEQSRSVVTAVSAPVKYSARQVQDVLALAGGGAPAADSRVVKLPRGTRPGFLSALSELIHGQAESARADALHAGAPLTYVHHGRFYELRGTSVQLKPELKVDASRYARVVSGEFAIKSLADGEETRFALSYALEGELVEVPLTFSCQPRWWLQVNLVLADDARPQ